MSPACITHNIIKVTIAVSMPENNSLRIPEKMSINSTPVGSKRKATIPVTPSPSTKSRGIDNAGDGNIGFSTELNKQRLAKLKVLKTVLKGVDYNTPAAREAIYANGRTGFSQLYANAIIVAEVAGTSNDGSVLNRKLPPEIALLLVEDEGELVEDKGALFRLVTGSELNRRLHALELEVKWNDLTTRIEKVPGINCIIYRTTVSYLNRFLTILQWYTNCDFFRTAEFIVKKQGKDGDANDYYFTPNHGLQLDCVHDFNVFQQLINVFLGETSLRSLNTSAAALTRTLNLAYAKYIGKSSKQAKDNTTTFGVLLFGMSNFRSSEANLFLKQMRTSLNDSKHDGNKYKRIFTVASRRIPPSTDVNGDTTTQSEGGNCRNLYTKFGSPYLLADIVRKFVTEGTTLQFTHVYLDHYIDIPSCALQEKALKDFYSTTIPLLNLSKLMSEGCKIFVPFNGRTVYHLHKAWPTTKAFASVKFRSNRTCNRWYNACENVSNSDALQKIEKKGYTLEQCCGTDRGKLISYLEGKIGCELELFDKRAEKRNKKQKNGNTNGEKCKISTTTSIDELRAFLTKWSVYNENQIKELKWIQLTVIRSEKLVGDFEWPNLTQLTGAPEPDLQEEPVVPDQPSVISRLTAAPDLQQAVPPAKSSEDTEVPDTRSVASTLAAGQDQQQAVLPDKSSEDTVLQDTLEPGVLPPALRPGVRNTMSDLVLNSNLRNRETFEQYTRYGDNDMIFKITLNFVDGTKMELATITNDQGQDIHAYVDVDLLLDQIANVDSISSKTIAESV